jgi:hypothetical protein
LNLKQAYLGLKFVIKGKVHFGWARAKVSVGFSITAVLIGYAYETIPGKPIIAWRPEGSGSRLGALAGGARRHRKRKERAAGDRRLHP